MTYPEAIFPRSHRIAGVRLRPMTLGHALLLQLARSPYAPDGPDREPGSGDIALLLWVCSRGYLRAHRGMGGSRWKRLWVAWRSGVIRPDIDLHRACADAYIMAQWRGPRFEPARSGEPLNAPHLALLKVSMMVDMGLSERLAMERPLALCLWDMAVQQERAGHVNLVGSTPRGIHALIAAARQLAQKEVGRG